MTSDQSGSHSGAAASTAIPRERMRWFTGRFVTAHDLTDEQAYFLRRRWMLNRILHGEGVLCGMEVVEHDRPECRSTTVFVQPGIALDCMGRELVLDCRLCVTWAPAATPAASEPSSEKEEVLLAVRYCEEDVAPRYAVQDACATSTVRQPSRIRECVDYGLLSRESAPHCWPDDPGTVHDDCDDPGRCGCIEPVCRCGRWVPLAVLTREGGGAIAVTAVAQRPVAGAHLTRIRQINWPHGRSLTLAEIAARKGRLEIDFDRPLDPGEGEATGINQFTFRVEMVGAQRAPELVPFETAPGLEGRTKAVFTIDPDFWDSTRTAGGKQWRPELRGQAVMVALMCDFVLDCHGQPVDGDHLRGVLPSGNGTPGGVFRSWFTVSE